MSLTFSFEASQHLRGLSTYKVLHDSPEITPTLSGEDLLAGFFTVSSVMQLPRRPRARFFSEPSLEDGRKAPDYLSELCDALLCLCGRFFGE